MPNDYRQRKAERKRLNDAYMAKIAGTVKIHIKCGACNGSGRYDNTGSPRCAACEGTGRETLRVKPEEVEAYRSLKK